MLEKANAMTSHVKWNIQKIAPPEVSDDERIMPSFLHVSTNETRLEQDLLDSSVAVPAANILDMKKAYGMQRCSEIISEGLTKRSLPS
jgi:hypothetical protein